MNAMVSCLPTLAMNRSSFRHALMAIIPSTRQTVQSVLFRGPSNVQINSRTQRFFYAANNCYRIEMDNEIYSYL